MSDNISIFAENNKYENRRESTNKDESKKKYKFMKSMK